MLCDDCVHVRISDDVYFVFKYIKEFHENIFKNPNEYKTKSPFHSDFQISEKIIS